jgi:hypothetical protein
MPKQRAFPGLRDAIKKKQTRRDLVLAEMDAVVPWGRLLALIEPHYPKSGPKGGRPPMPLETMLRVYFLQNWYALSDPMAEEMLYDSEAMLDFGPDHGDDAVDLRINRVKVTALRCLTHHTPEFALILERRLAFGADIAFVGPDRSFLAVQKLIPDLAVMNFCRRRIEAVGHPAVHIHADVCFHPEIPVISLLGG